MLGNNNFIMLKVINNLQINMICLFDLFIRLRTSYIIDFFLIENLEILSLKNMSIIADDN